jgi:hypothetical protein
LFNRSNYNHFSLSGYNNNFNKKNMSKFKRKKKATKKQIKETKIIKMNGGKKPTANNFQFKILPPYQRKNNTINLMPFLFNTMIDPRINMRIIIFTFMNFNFTWITHNGKK